eukprot:TRINITY_DN11854_c0_g3_i1.p1 TRINITY_DN11854_c0_g3~~TRINITY_DN11854_c0_g3_i1.p1  ORF type:complete len:399 (+),score=51.85 TRINITY_DN11854_c0_g3_i1:60-1199(+)
MPPVLIRGTYVKTGEPSKVVQALVPEESTVGELKESFKQQLGMGTRMVYKGSVIEDDGACLREVDLLPTKDRMIPHVHLCDEAGGVVETATPGEEKPSEGLRRRRAAPPRQAQPVPEPQPPQQRDDTGRGEPAVCRLCFDDEETTETGKLFSPCLCTGSMRYIHVTCLNRWRTRSQKETSYYQCDQCRFKYNLQKAKWAEFLLDARLYKTVAVLFLILGTLVSGVSVAQVPYPVHAKTWQLLTFNPLHYLSTKTCYSQHCTEACNGYNFWSWMDDCNAAGCLIQGCSMVTTPLQEQFCKILTNGMVVVGLCGLYLRRNQIVTNWQGFAFTFAMLFSSLKYARFIIVIGIVNSYYVLHGSARLKAKELMTRFGEIVLAVG